MPVMSTEEAIAICEEFGVTGVIVTTRTERGNVVCCFRCRAPNDMVLSCDTLRAELDMFGCPFAAYVTLFLKHAGVGPRWHLSPFRV